MFLDTVPRSRSKLIEVPPPLATPITGTLRWPRFTIACSAGKIFLYARSPVAPKKTKASECGNRSSQSPRAGYLPAAFC